MFSFENDVIRVNVNSFKSQIQNYFDETLGQEIDPVVWQPSRRLPLFLRTDYSHYKISLLGTDFLIMFDQDSHRSAANIQKHLLQLRDKWEGEVIYSRLNVSSLERKRLVERKIPFVIPGNQMYLPMLGIDFREYFRQLHDEVEKFSPATTAALLLIFNEPSANSYDASELTSRLEYSSMTMSRSLNELKNANIDVITLSGRTRRLEHSGSRRDLWEKCLPLLDSPVKQTHFVRTETKRPRFTSGLTALAKYSMLAAPRPPMFAMTQEEWRELESRGDVTQAKPTDPRATGIEVWSYSPALFAKDNHVDQFSLYLSLRDDPDERVEEALEEMMEGVSW